MTSRSRVSAAALAVLGGMAIVALTATPAIAHSEFQPDSVPAGGRSALKLYVENEQADAGTVEVQLFLPTDGTVVLAELPAAPGWTTTVDGKVGTAVKSVTWKRATAEPEDVLVPLTLGLPANVDRLQFQVFQTYSNGDTDAWAEDWPEGAPEPESPGPILRLTGAGSPAPSPTSVSAPPTTNPPTTTTIGTAAPKPSGDDSNAALPIALAIAVLVLGGAGFMFLRRRRHA